MRIISLSQDTRKDVLNDLLKRSPNNYGQYESTVNEIIENVKQNGVLLQVSIHENMLSF